MRRRSLRQDLERGADGLRRGDPRAVGGAGDQRVTARRDPAAADPPVELDEVRAWARAPLDGARDRLGDVARALGGEHAVVLLLDGRDRRAADAAATLAMPLRERDHREVHAAGLVDPEAHARAVLRAA